MKNKFDFYEVVIIASTKPNLHKINGTKGVILGMAQNEKTGRWGYAISMYTDNGLCWHIMEEDLISTGEKAKKEDFYTGESVKIRVDLETGEGRLAEDDESGEGE